MLQYQNSKQLKTERDSLEIRTIGGGLISDSMARDFALSISDRIKEYISLHHAEYLAWEAEQTEDKND